MAEDSLSLKVLENFQKGNKNFYSEKELQQLLSTK